MDAASILGAFSEEQVLKLTGLRRGQLSSWRRSGFVEPEFKNGDNPYVPFTFVYSFRNLLTLRVLNQLRNVHGVSLRELKKTGAELRKFGIDDWASRKLWVFNGKVVFEEPESEKKREISSRQFIAAIPLDMITADAREDIKKLNQRDASQIGKTEKRRQVVSSAEVFSGTRIPLRVVIDYLRAGKSDREIMLDYPDLREKDIAFAHGVMTDKAA